MTRLAAYLEAHKQAKDEEEVDRESISDQPFTFADLRKLSDAVDLLRVIEADGNASYTARPRVWWPGLVELLRGVK